MSLVAITVLALTQAKLDANYIVQARYPAASLKADTQALGGFGESKNFPKPRQVKSKLQSKLSIQLQPNDFGLTVRLFNASQKDEWLRAADGNMMAWLEAEDKGEWKPIEYHMWYTCGNSFHQVVLPPGYEWTYERPLPKGSWKTKVRWVVQQSGGLLKSDPIEMSIASTRTRLTPAEATKSEIVASGNSYPMVRQRRTNR